MSIELARQQHLGSLLHRTAARMPDKLAVVHGDARQTWAQFDSSVNRYANALSARGIGRGDRVVVFAHNSREFLLTYLGLARLGAVSVPVNFMLRAEDLAFIIGHSNAAGIVCEDALVPVADAAWGERPATVKGCIGTAAGWEPVADWEAHPDDSTPDVPVGDDDLIQLMYTSGTESRPKGAMLSSRSLISQFVSCIVDGRMRPDDVEVHALPFYHCAALHCFFGPDLYLGATSIVLPGAEPRALLETVERERATKLFCPPTVWISLLRCPDFDTRDLSSLRTGYYGASPMPVEILKELLQRLPGVELFNLYGQTELAPLATLLLPEDQMAHAGSAGRAALNVETLVVDDDDRPVPPGTIGEIVHRSPHAMLGYLDDPQRTAEAFRNGWFHSGDLGVLDTEGYLTVVDRKKDMIKSGGENVASREVEEALFEHPDVAEVAVFGLAHPYWVEAVTAIVVPKAGTELDTDQLIAFARTRLAGFKVPKYIALADALPKNPSGKILKRELRTTYAQLASS